MDVRQVEVGLKNVEISGQSFYSTGITDPRFTGQVKKWLQNLPLEGNNVWIQPFFSIIQLYFIWFLFVFYLQLQNTIFIRRTLPLVTVGL